MLRLISLNMEGNRHYDRIIPFLEKENADCICLQEVPSKFIDTLFRMGYFVAFAPMTYSNHAAENDTFGVAVATKSPCASTTHYYVSETGTPHVFEKNDIYCKQSFPVISTTILHDQKSYTIATTHLCVTLDGHENPAQIIATESLLSHTSTLAPHLLCGDMNMPRGYNTNYKTFCQRYKDEVPSMYKSSLDRSIHRLGSRPDLNAPIFDIYMVDYIFSQEPYVVDNVKLHFGVSDHAAVTADITLA